MQLRPIHLSVKRSQFRCDDPTAEEADKAFQLVRKDILKRDNHTCQFCGFRAEKFQEVHHVDDNHANNDPSNLVTACCLCHAAHHVGLSGMMQRGAMIYIDPELGMTQASINQLVRALWIAEVGGNREMSMAAIGMLSRLYKATVTARRKIGTSDATVFGDFLLNLDDEAYEARSDRVKGLCFLPFKEAFEKQLAYWNSSAFQGMPSDTWADIAKQRLQGWTMNSVGDDSDAALAKELSVGQK